MHMLGQGPNPRTRGRPRTRKTLPKGSTLVREGMEFNRNHPGRGLRKNPSSARQCREENVWLVIKSDTPDHSMEQDKCQEGTRRRKA